jgi:hypothetical protein
MKKRRQSIGNIPWSSHERTGMPQHPTSQERRPFFLQTTLQSTIVVSCSWMCLLFVVLQGCHDATIGCTWAVWSKFVSGARRRALTGPVSLCFHRHGGIPRSRYCSWVLRHPLHLLVLLRLHCHVPCRVLRRETPECISHWIDQCHGRVFCCVTFKASLSLCRWHKSSMQRKRTGGFVCGTSF